jgi:hypothetical protein
VFLEWVRELSIEGFIAVYGMGKSKGDQLLYLWEGERVRIVLVVRWLAMEWGGVRTDDSGRGIAVHRRGTGEKCL